MRARKVRQNQERLRIDEIWQETGYIFVQEDGLPVDPDPFEGIPDCLHAPRATKPDPARSSPSSRDRTPPTRCGGSLGQGKTRS